MFPVDIPREAGNNAPGIGAKFFLAPVEWFDTFASPAAATGPGDSVLITTPHTFKDLPTPSPAPSPMPSPIPTYGFVQAYSTNSSGKADVKQVGSPDNYGIEKSLECHVPGIGAIWFEMMAMPSEYIILVQLGNCDSPTYLQYGTKCDPCLADGHEWSSGTKGGTDKRGFTLKFKAFMTTPLLYTATVPRVGSWT